MEEKDMRVSKTMAEFSFFVSKKERETERDELEVLS